MKKEDAKGLALSSLLVLAALLAADDAWLHWRIGRFRQDAERRIGALEAAADAARAEEERPKRSWTDKLRFWDRNPEAAAEE